MVIFGFYLLSLFTTLPLYKRMKRIIVILIIYGDIVLLEVFMDVMFSRTLQEINPKYWIRVHRIAFISFFINPSYFPSAPNFSFSLKIFILKHFVRLKNVNRKSVNYMFLLTLKIILLLLNICNVLSNFFS